MEARAGTSLQTISSKSNNLNSYYMVTGDAGYITHDLARYQAVTPDSMLDAAKTYFGEQRVVLHVTPAQEQGGE